MERFVCEQTGLGEKFGKLLPVSDRSTQLHAFRFLMAQFDPNN